MPHVDINQKNLPAISHEDLQEILNRDYVAVGAAAKILRINRGNVRYNIKHGKLRALHLNVWKGGKVQCLNLVLRDDVLHFKPKPYLHFRARTL